MNRRSNDIERAKQLGMTVDEFQSLVGYDAIDSHPEFLKAGTCGPVDKEMKEVEDGEDAVRLKKKQYKKAESSDTYQPPAGAKGNAQRVLKWKEEHGSEVKGMTSVGWNRARQLASGKPISADTVKRMAAFNRHRKNAAVDPKYKNEPWKDAGYVAWLGWGGTTGIDWAIRTSEAMDKKSSGGEKPGLWENIRKKKEREGDDYRPAPPGSKDRPTEEQLKRSQTKKSKSDELDLSEAKRRRAQDKIGAMPYSLHDEMTDVEGIGDGTMVPFETDDDVKNKRPREIEHYWKRPVETPADKALYYGYHIHSKDNRYGLHAHYPGGPLGGGHTHGPSNPLGYHTHRYSPEELTQFKFAKPGVMIELDGPHTHQQNAPDGKHMHSEENFGPASDERAKDVEERNSKTDRN